MTKTGWATLSLAVLGASAFATARAAPVRPETAVYAGGCVWGVQAVFAHVNGVLSAESGYVGGSAGTASYDRVSSGTTGHAEAVRVVFDPAKVSYAELLEVFFTVAHDPTQLNRQGPDVGTQYRSAVWYTTPAQKQAVEGYIARATKSGEYRRRIVTEVGPLEAFHAAEAYHQDYYFTHPNSAYIVYNDVPKVEALERRFPKLWRAKASRITARS